MFSKYKNLIVVTIVCVFALILLSFKITDVPPGINGDEVGIAHNAVLISRNLTDENNNFLPLFIYASASSDWKQPVTVYATAAVFKIFGVSFATLRVTSVLFVLVSVVIFFVFCREMYDLKFFLVGSFVLLTTPIILIQSHLTLENIAVLPFIFLWLLMLSKNKKPVHAFLAGIFLGIGVFSYLGMRIIVPVLLLITLVYLRKNLKHCILFLSGVLPFFVLLFVSSFYYPSATVGSYSAPDFSLSDFVLRYLSVFDLSFMFLKGDATLYHSTGKAGMFLVLTLPIFLLGIWEILKRKKRFEVLVLLSFFLSPILFGFVPDIHRASRLLALVPFYVIISTLGLLKLPKKAAVITVLLILIGYWFFATDYWYSYPDRVKGVFPITIDKYDNEFVKK